MNDTANITIHLGASPVMAHAQQEVAQMSGLASSLVLNIGTLTNDFIEAMKIAAKSANHKGIPVVLDVCGAGATSLRDEKSLELLKTVKIDIIKGNASEIARLSGEKIQTKGVDAARVEKDLIQIAQTLAKKYHATVVVTGKEDIVADQTKTYLVKNGHPMMSNIVGTGCMATSVIGAFAAVEKNLALAAACALVVFEVAAECAVKKSGGPGTFKIHFYDCLFHLDQKTINKLQKVEA